VREWLARAARARRDRAWVAEGVIADRWAPAAPNGALDAFVWRTPDERLSEPPPEITLPPAPPPPAPPAVAAPAKSGDKLLAEPVAPPRARRMAAPPSLLPANAPDDPGPNSAKFRNFAME